MIITQVKEPITIKCDDYEKLSHLDINKFNKVGKYTARGFVGESGDTDYVVILVPFHKGSGSAKEIFESLT